MDDWLLRVNENILRSIVIYNIVDKSDIFFSKGEYDLWNKMSCVQKQSYDFNFRSWRGVLDTTLLDKVLQWLATGWWLSQGIPVSSTNKTDRHNIVKTFKNKHA